MKESFSFDDAVKLDGNRNQQKRSEELSCILKACYGVNSVSFDEKLDVTCAFISDDSVAKISLDFGDSSTSVAS